MDIVVEENSDIRKTYYKVLLILLKYLPHMLGTGYYLYSVLSLWYDVDFMGYIVSLSIIPCLYIIINSIVFKFCRIHRLPIYWIICNDLINAFIYYKEINIGKISLLVIFSILYLSICIIPIFIKKYKEKICTV